jgi:hypothetical protein
MRGIFILIVVAATVFYIRTKFQNVAPQATAPSSSPACLVLAGSTTREENGVTRIVGTLRNDCRRKFNNVMVEFLLDHSSRDPATTTTKTNPGETPSPAIDGPSLITASVSDLKPGTSAEAITFPVPSGTSYRVGAISAF